MGVDGLENAKPNPKSVGKKAPQVLRRGGGEVVHSPKKPSAKAGKKKK